MFKYLNFLLCSAAVAASANVSSASPSGLAAAMQLSFALLLAAAQPVSSWLRWLRRMGRQAKSRCLRKDTPRNVIHLSI
jgi:hypothetical protein